MTVNAIPTSVTFYPSPQEGAPKPVPAPSAFVPLMPDQVDLRSTTNRYLDIVKAGRVDTYV